MNEWILALTIILIATEIIFITARTIGRLTDVDWLGDKIAALFTAALYYVCCWLVPRFKIHEYGGFGGMKGFTYVWGIHFIIIGGAILLLLNKKISNFIYTQRLKNKKSKKQSRGKKK